MPESIGQLILTIISLLVLIIFGGSIYAFFYAIFLFIFSAGDPEKIKKAWNSIRFMILGIILTLSFLFIFPIIFKRMKLPGYEMYTASNVFSHASYLLRSLIGFGSEAIQEYQTDNNIGDGAADYEEPGPDPAPPQQLEL